MHGRNGAGGHSRSAGDPKRGRGAILLITSPFPASSLPGIQQLGPLEAHIKERGGRNGDSRAQGCQVLGLGQMAEALMRELPWRGRGQFPGLKQAGPALMESSLLGMLSHTLGQGLPL